jgi:hypothetical protein
VVDHLILAEVAGGMDSRDILAVTPRGVEAVT